MAEGRLLDGFYYFWVTGDYFLNILSTMDRFDIFTVIIHSFYDLKHVAGQINEIYNWSWVDFVTLYIYSMRMMIRIDYLDFRVVPHFGSFPSYHFTMERDMKNLFGVYLRSFSVLFFTITFTKKETKPPFVDRSKYVFKKHLVNVPGDIHLRQFTVYYYIIPKLDHMDKKFRERSQTCLRSVILLLFDQFENTY